MQEKTSCSNLNMSDTRCTRELGHGSPGEDKGDQNGDIYFMCTFTNLEQIFTKLQNIIYDKSPKRGLAYCIGLHLG